MAERNNTLTVSFANDVIPLEIKNPGTYVHCNKKYYLSSNFEEHLFDDDLNNLKFFLGNMGANQIGFSDTRNSSKSNSYLGSVDNSVTWFNYSASINASKQMLTTVINLMQHENLWKKFCVSKNDFV